MSAGVDIVIVGYNTAPLLRACLESVARCAPQARTIVVDNASRDGSAGMLRREFPSVHGIALDENLGFGAANNRGIAAGAAPDILFLNPDAELTPGALESLRAVFAAHPRCVIAGPRLRYPGGRHQPACRRFPTPLRGFWCNSGLQARFPGRFHTLHNWLDEADHETARAVDMVSGACFLARRSYMAQIGNFDENLFMYEEETDLSLPARRAKLEVRYAPEAVVLHHGGASVEASAMSAFSTRHLFRSKYVVFRKHYGAAAARRAYLLDAAVYARSALFQRLRGRPPEAAATLAQVRRAWRDSTLPIAALRARGDFFG